MKQKQSKLYLEKVRNKESKESKRVIIISDALTSSNLGTNMSDNP